MRRGLSCLFALWILIPAGAQPRRAARITVKGSERGQSWEGWGTTDLFSLDGLQVEPEAGKPGTIPEKIRKAILELYYRDLGMTRVRFFPMGYEPERGKGYVWKGRGSRPVNSVDPFCEDHLVLGREFRNAEEPFIFYPSNHQWEKWMTAKPESDKWTFGPDAKFDRNAVDGYAEHTLAAVLHIKQAYGYEIPFWSLFNEPSNTAKPDVETTLALVLACGRAFEKNKLGTRLVICDDVTPEASAKTIVHVLKNEEARRYVGAVSCHRYCGDFVLEAVKPMLAKIGRGEPLIKEPVSFYASAYALGKPVWLSEQCSYGADGITHFDAGRARANHICDEINNGRVSAFDFMLCYFIERGRPGNEEAPIFIRFREGKAVGAEINPFGAWISHFTKYIRSGSVHLMTSSDDALLKVVAFRHSDSLTVVVVNNHSEAVALTLELKELAKAAGSVGRRRSSPGALRAELPDTVVESAVLKDDLPATSVTTYLIPIR